MQTKMTQTHLRSGGVPMRSVVDRGEPIPLYEQIKMVFRDQITTGHLKPGMRLPTESDLCEQYSVSRITVVKALTDLARDGLIERIQGKGSIVSPARVQGSLNEVRGFAQTVKQNGLTPSSIVLAAEIIAGDADVRRAFRLPANGAHKFMKFRRLRFIDGVPAVLLDTTVSEEVGRKLLGQPLEDASFYKLYENLLGRRVERNDAGLHPIVADAETARLLQVKRGSPHFAFRGLSYLDGDIPIELAIGVYRGDMFTFSGTMYRIREEVVQRHNPTISLTMHASR